MAARRQSIEGAANALVEHRVIGVLQNGEALHPARVGRAVPPIGEEQNRIIVSPLVTWIWLGAILILLGGVIAIWPPPGGATRRVRAGYLARVGRETAATSS